MLSYAASPNRSGWKIRCFVGERKTGILPVLWALLRCTQKKAAIPSNAAFLYVSFQSEIRTVSQSPK
jgi:hypothetical protein